MKDRITIEEKVTLTIGDTIETEGLTTDHYNDVCRAFLHAGFGAGEFYDNKDDPAYHGRPSGKYSHIFKDFSFVGVHAHTETINHTDLMSHVTRALTYNQIVTATNAQQPEVESMQELTLTEAQKELKSIIQRKAELESFVVKSMAEFGATVKFDKPERVYNDWRDLVVGDWIEILTSTDRRDDVLVGGRYKVNNLEHREHKESGCCVECLILAEGSCYTIWLDNHLTTFTLAR